jgi:hypothetical protein
LSEDTLLSHAVINNICWCDAVVRAHGARTVFRDDYWASEGPDVPFYPRLVSRTRRFSSEQVSTVLEQVARGPQQASLGVKDSYGLWNPESGFTLLFESQWIGLETAESIPVSDASLEWSAVSGSVELGEWTTAWARYSGEMPDLARSIFTEQLLAQPNVVFLMARRSPGTTAGAVLFRDSHTVGISNIFFENTDHETVWKSLTSHLRSDHSVHRIVGYENGRDLEAAENAGFRRRGPLKVWLRNGQRQDAPRD